MNHEVIGVPVEPNVHFDQSARLARLERQIARERAARHEAETIAEKGLRDLFESQRRLLLLQCITDAANKASDIDDALELAVREICSYMGWDFGNAYLVSTADNAAVACNRWFAAHPDQLFRFVEVSRWARFTYGTGLPGRVLKDAAPHWIDDVRVDDRFARRAIAADCGLISGCAFPILVGEEVVAMMEFFSRKQLQEKEELIQVIAQIGVQLGRVVERSRARQALLHDALHDSLTNLPNRALLADRASEAFEALADSGTGIAMLMIDLDGFKAVNDRFGHLAGDQLLVEVAGRLRQCVDDIAAYAEPMSGRRETLARMGGDEFVVLLEHPTPDLPERLAVSIHETLAEPVCIADEWVTVGASIGIAHSDAYHVEVGQVLRDADLAMYAAKDRGRGTTVLFTDELGHAIRQKAALERSLREAIRTHEFVLHYQPIIDLAGQEHIAGFEALVRWNHPERGLVLPGEFIPAAEENGLIIFIGDWVLEEACRAFSDLHKALPKSRRPFLSINIAPLQFLQPNFVDRVKEVIMTTGIDPTLVRLEVTEGVAIMDAERTAMVLSEIRDWGVRTSLDDFGTGYSSLSYLQKLPFDTLKIDRSFVSAIEDPKSQNIVRTILDLARNMDLSVVAEGIETDAQRLMLERMGCSLGQGFYYGAPCDETRMRALAGARSTSRAA